MKGWQKGFLYGFLFATAISVFYSLILIYLDFKLEKKGLPHMCFAFTESVICTFEQAIYTRLGFIIVLVLVFGIPLAIFGALIGAFTDNYGMGK
jgi:hypothetical protein